jgi:hypothetical protein
VEQGELLVLMLEVLEELLLLAHLPYRLLVGLAEQVVLQFQQRFLP